MTTPSPCAWQGSVSEFLATPEERVLSDLTAFLRETGAPQILAWDRSLRVLRDELQSCLPDAAGFALVLEFELPRSGGRRPDLIVLENGLVLVIEFKNRVAAEPADIAQVKGYIRDLEEYHAACRRKTLVPLLVPIGMEGDPETRDGVRIVPSRKLGAVIRELSKGGAGKRGDGEAFLRAPFEPLPALVEAARLLFEKKPLPRIRAAESARIPQTVARLEGLARDVRATGKRTLALVSGVPGSGKTLVGLQLVHSRDLGAPAVFLSGNGPLVNVLQYVLENREFVRDMKKFIHDHLVRTQSPPRESVVVFDEAQRAWDRDRVLKKHRGAFTARCAASRETRSAFCAAAMPVTGARTLAPVPASDEVMANAFLFPNLPVGSTFCVATSENAFPTLPRHRKAAISCPSRSPSHSSSNCPRMSATRLKNC